MKYSLATNWSGWILPGIIPLNSKQKDKVFELFGCLPTSVFGHARQAVQIPNVSNEEIEKAIKRMGRRGIKFNYLLNSSVSPRIETLGKHLEALEHLTWIKNLGADIVTVGNEKTLNFIRENFPDLPVNLSVVMAIRTAQEAEKMFEKYPNIKRITPHQTVNRDKEELSKIIGLSHQCGIEVELLANEICVYDCPKMKEHYSYMSKTSQNPTALGLKPLKWCRQINLKNKLAFLNACWIRPEDVSLYENLGVDILKISGRGEKTDYLLQTIEAYLQRSFDGNTLDLFYQKRFCEEDVLPNYPNKKLDGFIEYLFENGLKKIDWIPEKFDPSGK